MSEVVLKSFRTGGYTYELKKVRCGKPTCGKCPHGPYWYLKIALRDRKPVVKYIGVSLPEGVEEPK